MNNNLLRAKTQYTWRYVAKTVLTQVADKDEAEEVIRGAGIMGWGLLTFFVRIMLLVLFPVSVPLIVYVMRSEERESASTFYGGRRVSKQKEMK